MKLKNDEEYIKKRDYISFLLILILNILLITKKIKFGTESISNVSIIGIFLVISIFINGIKENSKLDFKIRIVICIIILLIWILPIDIIPSRQSHSFMYIIFTESFMLYYILYFFTSNKKQY